MPTPRYKLPYGELDNALLRLDTLLSGAWSPRIAAIVQATRTFAYHGGTNSAGVIIPDGTIVIPDGGTYYVQRTAAGVVSADALLSFPAKIPIARCTTAGDKLTNFEDMRDVAMAQLAMLLNGGVDGQVLKNVAGIVTWGAGGGSGGAADFVPDTDNAFDIGTLLKQWRTGRFKTSVVTPKLSNPGGGTVLETLTQTGGLTLTGTSAGYTLTRPAASGANWDQQAIAAAGIAGSAHVTAKATFADKRIMLGLSVNPAASASYLTIDYAIHVNNLGQVSAWNSGVQQGSTLTTYVAGDVFTISYSGTTIEFAKNGVVFYTKTIAANLVLKFDSSFYDPSGQLMDVVFSHVNVTTIEADAALNAPEFQVAGVKVVGARQAAIPVATAGTELARINAIRDALIAHGLIAP